MKTDFLEYTYNEILNKQDQLLIDEANFKNADGNQDKRFDTTEEYVQKIIEIQALRDLIRSYNINKGEIFYE